MESGINARYRFYYDGKLMKSSMIDLNKAIRWMDNAQADWSKNLMPQVAPGEFDPNNGSEVTRVSQTELLVTTTGGHKLRWILADNSIAVVQIRAIIEVAQPDISEATL